jgi:hypothetical protein
MTGSHVGLGQTVRHELPEKPETRCGTGADGKIGWKATPRMLQRLADAERDAID